MIRVVAANELRRRLRDRSMLITCIVAPLALASILGFAFAGGTSGAPVRIGVAGASPALIAQASRADQLPRQVHLERVATAAALVRAVDGGRLTAGVIVTHAAARLGLSRLLVPILAPGTSHLPGFKVKYPSTSLVGGEWADSVAAAIASRLYAARLVGGPARHPSTTAALDVTTDPLGSAGKGVLNYFAPSIAVIFLFIGGGLGLRSLLLERSGGTLVRMAAAPVRPNRIVAGKLVAILVTGLVSVFVVWGVTATVFGADWGAPAGVVLMSLGSTVAMCGLGVFLTSLAKDEQAALGVALLVGLLLSLLGGNLLPAGALPPLLQKLSLITPNGWALVGFGRLALLHEGTGQIVDPFLVLCAISVVTTGLALTRVRRMVRP
ncbi:MAG TPA: ABC transporter permease, partial [Acidimicrobiales bacterium]|nr:ABC transporter permease [Acidimicrobiales bacterium]